MLDCEKVLIDCKKLVNHEVIELDDVPSIAELTKNHFEFQECQFLE